MDLQVNEHDRVNRILAPLSSAMFKTPTKSNGNVLLGKSSWIDNGAQSEQVLRAKSSGERRQVMSDSKFQGSLCSQIMIDPSVALHDVGNKFREVLHLKKGCYADLPPAKNLELISNSLDKAPTQSLLSIVNGILDENLERQQGEIPYNVACLLRKVMQEIELRMATQAEHLRMHSCLSKAREEKYKSRIQVLEAIAAANSEETKTITEEKAKIQAQHVFRLMKEKDQDSQEIAFLKQERDAVSVSCKERCLQIEFEARRAQDELEQRLKEAVNNLTESRKRVEELEAIAESRIQDWNKKDHIYNICTEFQLGGLQDLRFASQSIRQEVEKTQNIYKEEFEYLGKKVRALEDAARNYYGVLAENKKLHNEVQELRGNIRVYCRIRPFLPQKEEKLSTVEFIGENGKIVVKNPSKPGNEAHRLFKFDKIYGPSSTQDEVFSDIQPLVQSVLDGYNVCIFAYGQTGSGKTYTMVGPYGATEEQWGVNYRALNDLFRISRAREGTFTYEIGVQMVEIYNEQVRDLLSSSTSQKKLGILSTSRPSGLSVPDASMYSVNSTFDVLELMDIGLKNRAQSSTTLNERSSRSHSVVTIHVRGTDLKTGFCSRSSLHLVDLAGSERVERSEVTGDRLKETQHINKSLSALGDVIFALAQKSSHVPYRNSKLTQVLQSALGGKAKTLMFVQISPDTASYSETVSTLKFAERVSGVELGAAKSSKDGMDVRELIEQVASLKDMISRKDEEIERLQPLKDLKNVLPGVGCAKEFSKKHVIGDTMQGNLLPGEDSGPDERTTTDQENYSEGSSEQHSDVISQNHDNDVIGHWKELDYLHQQQVNTIAEGNAVHSLTSNAENEKRPSDASNSDLSMETESMDFNETKKLSRKVATTSKKKERPKTTSRISRASSRSPMDTPKASTGLRKSSSGTNLSTNSSRKWH